MTKSNDTYGCEGCAYWVEGTETGDEVRWGFCRRFPPTVIAADSDEGAASVQAWTVLPHWCGEHKQRLQ